LLAAKPARILDLGCGPGLYAMRFAALGHQCVGIDFSPASIAYAEDEAERYQLDAKYIHGDIRTATYPERQDLVMLIYGELNVFSAADARSILTKAAGCLTESGRLLLEVHGPGVIQRRGQEPSKWYSAKSGLWSDSPHVCLHENYWDSERKTAITRYFVIDSATGEVTPSSASYQDYTDAEYESLLFDAGFESIGKLPSLAGIADESTKDFTAFLAGKKEYGKHDGEGGREHR
jgi:SAM-dependent methyltransferase